MCTGTTPACGNTCARGAGTHGDVLNLHTEVFFCVPSRGTHHTTPRTTHKLPRRFELFLVALCQTTGIVGLVWLTCNRFDDGSSIVVFSTNVSVGQFDRFALGSFRG